jgi:hypothetical protein|tara:strand:- start:535 stop:750 length:216 start_codon:yes stop_codon:yes gene_type:complete
MEWIEEVMNDEGASNVNMMKIISEEMLDEDKKELKRSAGVKVGPIELQLLDQSGKKIMNEIINPDGNNVVK